MGASSQFADVAGFRGAPHCPAAPASRDVPSSRLVRHLLACGVILPLAGANCVLEVFGVCSIGRIAFLLFRQTPWTKLHREKAAELSTVCSSGGGRVQLTRQNIVRNTPRWPCELGPTLLSPENFKMYCFFADGIPGQRHRINNLLRMLKMTISLREAA
jgi:hypothetical protein